MDNFNCTSACIFLGFAFIVLPIACYMCVKFGTFGYYKAKQKARQLFKK